MTELAKDLGLLEALTIGVGTMIGAGIFVLPGPATAVAGPAVALSFTIGGVISLLTAMSASELGTAMPRAGGSYYFVNHALGPIFGSIAGLGNWMGLAFASAFYAIGFGSYTSGFLPPIGVELGALVLTSGQVYALLAGSLFIAVNYIGAKETGRLQNAIVLVLVGILVVFVGACSLNADLSTLRPIAPEGWGAVLPATALVFVSFLGFAKITTVAEEIRNPGRNLPFAIIGSVLIVTVLYAAIMLLINAVMPWQELGGTGEIAVVQVAALVLGPIGAVALTTGGLLATASSANASILASSRINFAMGRDGLISPWLNDIHDRYATPHRSIALTGALILLFIVVGDVKTLAKAGSVLHLLVYGLLNLALIVMRESDVPGYEPDYRVPFYPVVPIAGAVTSFGLIAFMDAIEIALALLFVAVSVIWFYLYARRKTEKQGVFSQYVLSEPEAWPDSAVAAAEAVRPASDTYRVLVPLANPAHEEDLVALAGAIARQRDGTLVAVHIVEVPYQTPLEMGAEHAEELDSDTESLLELARGHAEEQGVEIETHTIFSHSAFPEIFEAARTHRADLVVLGWSEDSHGSPGRIENLRTDLTRTLPCDFLVFKDRGFDPSRILIPTRAGPESKATAEMGRLFREEFGSELTIFHVIDEESERIDAGTRIDEWRRSHGLEETDQRIVVARDVADAIEEAASDHTLVLMGATEEGILTRLARGTPVLEVIEDLDVSVLMAERARKRSVVERFFG